MFFNVKICYAPNGKVIYNYRKGFASREFFGIGQIYFSERFDCNVKIVETTEPVKIGDFSYKIEELWLEKV